MVAKRAIEDKYRRSVRRYKRADTEVSRAEMRLRDAIYGREQAEQSLNESVDEINRVGLEITDFDE